MKILLVHDRQDVSAKVESLLRESIAESDIVRIVEDGIGARRELSTNIYDLLIIDLTLPHIKGRGAANYTVVDHLLTELYTTDTFNIPGDVIGMTRDPDAQGLIDTSLGTHLMVTIHEDMDGNWQRYLREKLHYAMRAAKSRSVLSGRYYATDLLIVTALDKELQPYRSKFEFLEQREFPGANRFGFTDRNGDVRSGVAFSVGRAGQASAASATQSLLSFYRPQYAIMSGYCGGVKGKIELGDLMFFESSFDWDYGKWEEEKGKLDGSSEQSNSAFLSRPSPIAITDSKSHHAIRELLRGDFNRRPKLLDNLGSLSKAKLTKPEMHMYPAASGSAVVADDMIVSKIRGLNESIRAVDMESYGFYTACKRTHVVKPDFFCVKSVSDFCNGEKNDDFHAACSEFSCLAAIEIFTKIIDFQPI